MRSTLATVWLIAVREVRQRLRSKSIFVFTGLLAVVLVGIGVVNRVTTDEGPSEIEIGVSGEAPAGLSEALDAVAGQFDRSVVVTADVPDRASAEAALREDRLDVVVLAGAEELLSDGPVDDVTTSVVSGAWQLASAAEAASSLGLTPEQASSILAPAPLEQVSISEDESDTAVGQIVGTMSAVLLFMVISIFGSYVLTGVVEEKATAVVEILLSHVRAYVLLAGKVMGIGIVALMQFAVGVAAGLVALRISGASVPSDVWVALPAAIGWFVGGFALYSTLFALAGSFVSRQEEAAAAAAPVTVCSLVAYFVVFAVSETPDSAIATVVSLLPPFAPMLMPLRMATGVAPVWQVLLSAVLLVLAVYGVLRAAGAVYGRTLLHRGSRIGWREALRLSES